MDDLGGRNHRTVPEADVVRSFPRPTP
jgi:hypothetical protein